MMNSPGTGVQRGAAFGPRWPVFGKLDVTRATVQVRPLSYLGALDPRGLECQAFNRKMLKLLESRRTVGAR